ncbi:MAG TPA: isoprenylcysteine carboxylmethyltransferase family protein, partial [Mycobacterium sp.]|nr:isoprenylcysteine carboxylmethyltransferase family protein [Mycobacterium sp.]
NPALVQRRLRGGPAAETRTVQKLASTGLFVAFIALIVVSALDHRFGWSTPPAAVSVVGLVLVAAGFGIGILAVTQNSYAAANITVETEQPVISTGLYGLVRHPMYFSVVITFVGIPLALGSYWGLVLVLPGLAVLVVRILDEEKLLAQELSGYSDYRQQVRYRLLPYLW